MSRYTYNKDGLIRLGNDMFYEGFKFILNRIKDFKEEGKSGDEICRILEGYLTKELIERPNIVKITGRF